MPQPTEITQFIFGQPLSAGSIVDNVLEHGTGALNIEACRISTGEDLVIWQEAEAAKGKGIFGPKKGSTTGKAGKFKNESGGRWPANVVHDGSPEVMAEFATQSERM